MREGRRALGRSVHHPAPAVPGPRLPRRRSALAGLALALGAAAGCAWLGLGGEEPPRSPTTARVAAPAPPDALQSAVRRDFPGQDVPRWRDQLGSGDFDGDGRADFALLLAGARGSTLAIYFQDARRGFRLAWPEAPRQRDARVSEGSQAPSLRVLRAGSPYLFTRQEAGRGYRGTTSSSFRFERDAVVLVRGEADETLFHWDGSRFETLRFGD